jgi:putative transposase
MQLISGRTAQEFNRRQQRKGAFWEDRYHATAVQTNDHLARCMVYIDLNMVRAGEVTHPMQWESSGYFESNHPKPRAGRLDMPSICRLLKCESSQQLNQRRDEWINDRLQAGDLKRQSYWTDSVAVGDLDYALKMKRALAFNNPGRRARRESGCFAVREASGTYVA